MPSEFGGQPNLPILPTAALLTCFNSQQKARAKSRGYGVARSATATHRDAFSVATAGRNVPEQRRISLVAVRQTCFDPAPERHPFGHFTRCGYKGRCHSLPSRANGELAFNAQRRRDVVESSRRTPNGCFRTSVQARVEPTRHPARLELDCTNPALE